MWSGGLSFSSLPLMSQAKPPYIIVGQGIAGSVLSMGMQERGIAHQVIDDPSLSQSSRIAAGLANPIVLKRLKWVQDAEHFWPAMEAFYPRWEKDLDRRFFFPIAMHHLFSTVGELNRWQERSAEAPFADFLGPSQLDLPPYLHAKIAYGILPRLYWLQTKRFIEAYRQKLQSAGQYVEISLGEAELHQWQAEGQSVIICNGHLMRQLLSQTASAFAPTKGEVLIVEAPELPQDRAWHAKVFALPLGNGRFKVGASYSHDQVLKDEPSPEGETWLRNAFEAFYRGSYKVVEHWAGVRPNVVDRKPLLGALAPSLYAFNGMGSRGVLMAPYLAQHLLDHLELGKDLNPAWDIKRFLT